MSSFSEKERIGCSRDKVVTVEFPAAQEDHVPSEVPGDPACANVYLWHPEGPPRPPGEGAPT